VGAHASTRGEGCGAGGGSLGAKSLAVLAEPFSKEYL
jgi:hypothetical protein